MRSCNSACNTRKILTAQTPREGLLERMAASADSGEQTVSYVRGRSLDTDAAYRSGTACGTLPSATHRTRCSYWLNQICASRVRVRPAAARMYTLPPWWVAMMNRVIRPLKALYPLLPPLFDAVAMVGIATSQLVVFVLSQSQKAVDLTAIVACSSCITQEPGHASSSLSAGLWHSLDPRNCSTFEPAYVTPTRYPQGFKLRA